MRENEEIGALLVERGVITEKQLVEALKVASDTQHSLQRALIEKNIATKEHICDAIAGDAGVPYLDINNYLVDPKVVDLVPEEIAKKHHLFPVFKIGNALTIAMVDPTDLIGIDQVGLSSNCEVEACLSSEQDIEEAISDGYGAAKGVEDLLQSMQGAKAEGGAVGAGRAPIVRLVELLLTQAVRDRASDIHIEPEPESLRIRFRVDGMLYDIPAPPKHLEPAIISRVKVLGNMDIATSRVPQDGHFQAKIDEKDVDIRVSSVPTINGENLSLRLLVTKDALLGLGQLGFSERCMKQFESIISRPYGMILATGPTGSGKSTTLYAALNKINTIDKNILTIEDPVEYRLPLIRQMQVNPKAGVTFAKGLRSMLRQDPDIVMVGEIRDLETADIAIQAALTGHLVFSTLHTNDAASALARLVNMGVLPFLMTSSITGVMAQRLVRRLCSKCKETYEPNRALLDSLGFDGKDVVFYRAKGCKFCKSTGYKGRVGIFELMEITDDIKDLIVEGATAAAIARKAQENGMKPMKEDGLEKALDSVTSLEEITRVTEARIDVDDEVGGETVGEDMSEAKDSPPARVEVPRPETETVDLNEYRQRVASWLGKR